MAFSEFDDVRNGHISNINEFLQEKWGITSYKLLVPGVLLQRTPGEKKSRAYPLVSNINEVSNPSDYRWRGSLPIRTEGSLVVYRLKNFGDHYHYFNSTASKVREDEEAEELTLGMMVLKLSMLYQLTRGYKGEVSLAGPWVFEDKISRQRRQVLLVDFDDEKTNDLEISSIRMIEQVIRRIKEDKLFVGK